MGCNVSPFSFESGSGGGVRFEKTLTIPALTNLNACPVVTDSDSSTQKITHLHSDMFGGSWSVSDISDGKIKYVVLPGTINQNLDLSINGNYGNDYVNVSNIFKTAYDLKFILQIDNLESIEMHLDWTGSSISVASGSRTGHNQNKVSFTYVTGRNVDSATFLDKHYVGIPDLTSGTHQLISTTTFPIYFKIPYKERMSLTLQQPAEQTPQTNYNITYYSYANPFATYYVKYSQDAMNLDIYETI